MLRVATARIEVDRYGWDELGEAFSLMNTEIFLRSGDVWAAHSEGLLAAGI